MGNVRGDIAVEKCSLKGKRKRKLKKTCTTTAKDNILVLLLLLLLLYRSITVRHIANITITQHKASADITGHFAARFNSEGFTVRSTEPVLCH